MHNNEQKTNNYQTDPLIKIAVQSIGFTNANNKEKLADLPQLAAKWF